MKRILLVLIIISSAAHAQVEKTSISAHLSYAWSNWLYASTDYITCYNAGIEVRNRIGESGFYLQSGIRWNEYGFADTIQTYYWDGETNIIMDDVYRRTDFYLTLPLIATYRVKYVLPGLTFSAGPQLSIYMTSKTKVNGNVNFNGGQQSILNFSLYSSIGYERNISERWILGGEAYANNMIGADLYYNFGIGISGRYILR